MTSLSGRLGRNIALALTAGALLLTVGCAETKEPSVQPPSGPTRVKPQPFDSTVGSIYSYETVIGTTKVYCLVYDGSRAGGLHCFTWQEVDPW